MNAKAGAGKTDEHSIRAGDRFRRKDLRCLAIIALATSVTLAHGDKKHVIGHVSEGRCRFCRGQDGGREKSVEVKLLLRRRTSRGLETRTICKMADLQSATCG